MSDISDNNQETFQGIYLSYTFISNNIMKSSKLLYIYIYIYLNMIFDHSEHFYISLEVYGNERILSITF